METVIYSLISTLSFSVVISALKPRLANWRALEVRHAVSSWCPLPLPLFLPTGWNRDPDLMPDAQVRTMLPAVKEPQDGRSLDPRMTVEQQ